MRGGACQAGGGGAKTIQGYLVLVAHSLLPVHSKALLQQADEEGVLPKKRKLGARVKIIQDNVVGLISHSSLPVGSAEVQQECEDVVCRPHSAATLHDSLVTP